MLEPAVPHLTATGPQRAIVRRKSAFPVRSEENSRQSYLLLTRERQSLFFTHVRDRLCMADTTLSRGFGRASDRAQPGRGTPNSWDCQLPGISLQKRAGHALYLLRYFRFVMFIGKRTAIALARPCRAVVSG